MKTISGKRLCRMLQAQGRRLARIKGSHHIFVKKGIVETISVPVHGDKGLKQGLQKHLMKIAEIKEL